jgi:ring-1,2-phenylacetyl-CoA epoxidase subunit PaaD
VTGHLVGRRGHFGQNAVATFGADRGRSGHFGRKDPREVAETVTDPELPTLTLGDLGVLRDVRIEDGTVVVEITPTYTGCPAMGVMRADLLHALHSAGFPEVDVRTVLSPAWTTDWITEDGRRKLAACGIAPPGTAPVRPSGPVPLHLGPSRRTAACPLCGSPDTEEISEFSSTACKALRRCQSCGEPFEHVKEI